MNVPKRERERKRENEIKKLVLIDHHLDKLISYVLQRERDKMRDNESEIKGERMRKYECEIIREREKDRDK